MNDLDTRLRRLDPARVAGTTAGEDGLSPRALADLDRIVATDPRDFPRAAAPRSAPHRRGRRLAVVGVAAAALVVGGALLPAQLLDDGDAAFATWTAVPSGMTPSEAADAAQECRESSADAWEGTGPVDAEVAVADRRGVWTTVMLVGRDGFSALCVSDSSAGPLAGGSFGYVGDGPGEAVGERALRAMVLGTGMIDGREVSIVAGLSGAQVSEVVYESAEHGQVRAEVSKGAFALWMPGDELGDGGSADLAVTFRDGSRGRVTVDLPDLPPTE
ncbi:MAG: hypothetical protein ACI379_14105 [Nocardioides sp.]|uniref:hypothetical protein n=1 Tax=Nocardioides sp. TaxID=35761 RepID=UPI003F0E0A3F